jgi:hypothetical protein
MDISFVFHHMPQENLKIDLPDVATRMWQELTRAPHDRHHEWRTPVLASQGINDTGPQARTVVLRHADAASWTLCVYTDARSPKCAELQNQPLTQLIFWSKRLNWQLRLAAVATVATDGELVQSAWERVRQSPAAGDYLSALPPGHIQNEVASQTGNSGGDHATHHLAVLQFNVSSMDWLALSQDGHRRAKLSPAGSATWLVP